MGNFCVIINHVIKDQRIQVLVRQDSKGMETHLQTGALFQSRPGIQKELSRGKGYMIMYEKDLLYVIKPSELEPETLRVLLAQHPEIKFVSFMTSPATTPTKRYPSAHC